MDHVSEQLIVFFEEPFWVGVFEQRVDDVLFVSKVIFGAEPKDYEIYEFIQERYSRLQYSPGVTVEVKTQKKNPKRVQREVHKQVAQVGIGTKSQQALKLLQEQKKDERKHFNREQKEAEEQMRYQQKQLKKKEKHRGR